MSNMRQVKFSCTDETFKRLTDFIMKKYGTRRARSITIEQALKEFLDKEALIENQNNLS